MTQLQFMGLCGLFLIDPELALENENIRKALAERNDEEVKKLLVTEF